MLLYYSKCCRITISHIKTDNSNQMISDDFTLVIIIGKLDIEIKSHKPADRTNKRLQKTFSTLNYSKQNHYH
jgi:hypothetical protein